MANNVNFSIETVGVVGIGIVGNAICTVMEEKEVRVIKYDKYKPEANSLGDILRTDAIFLCLPTPYSNETKCFDKSALQETVEFLSDYHYSGLVIVKSTVEPGTTENYAKRYNLSVVHNPEFLKARSAVEDFRRQNHIVVGKTDRTDPRHLEGIVNHMKVWFQTDNVSLCTSTESELMKIAVNNFYATKIMFFNELFLVCSKLHDTTFEKVKDMMLRNDCIHSAYTNVPGYDGKLAYGGACFPKDTEAYLQFLRTLDCPSAITEATVHERNVLRSSNRTTDEDMRM
jgi:UDPglucose 6-dehydrogenase